jgi:hypothetical protein
MAGAQQPLVLLLVLLLASEAVVLALRQLDPTQIPDHSESDNRHKKKKKKPYTSPPGLFIQVRLISASASPAIDQTNSWMPLWAGCCGRAGTSIQAATRARPALQLWRVEAMGGDS